MHTVIAFHKKEVVAPEVGEKRHRCVSLPHFLHGHHEALLTI